MSKVASNMKPVYELFQEEVKKDNPDVNILELLIDRLPKEDINKITELTLINKNLYKLPNNIGNLTNLQYFDCSYNKISVFPNSIGNLINLQGLWIYYNQISTLPDNIGNLTNLQKLWISNNQISEVPKWLNDMNIPDMRT